MKNITKKVLAYNYLVFVGLFCLSALAGVVFGDNWIWTVSTCIGLIPLGITCVALFEFEEGVDLFPACGFVTILIACFAGGCFLGLPKMSTLMLVVTLLASYVYVHEKFIECTMSKGRLDG